MSDPEGNPYVRDPPAEFDPVDELTEERAREQARQLREAIREHDYRYYVEADPTVADRTYDRLFARLRDLEEAFDLDDGGSPTRRVGGEPVDRLRTVEHVAPMLSIDQSVDAADVRAFDGRVRRELDGPVEYVCEPKFDGLSVEVIYEDGRYERAATRGDGRRGDDVTAQVRTVGAVPLSLRGDPPPFLAVRGEVYMPREAFREFNRERVETGEEPFANPRNAAAGSLRQHDPGVVAERPLACFFYEVLDASEAPDTHRAALSAFREWGLPVSGRETPVADVEAALEYRDALLEEREELDYEVDGAVIKVDDRSARERLGATERSIRWAFAYKFPAREEVTTLTDVAIQVGRTGRLTPVALLDPVDVGGVTVSRASLHNPAEIADLGANVGDRVRVKRAGDVIPYVAEVVEKRSEGQFEFPERCPVCDSPVERDGPIAFCTGGLACDAQLERTIRHYAGKSGLDVEGLGAERVEQLVDEGAIERLPDLYRLDADALTALEGWGETSAENLVAEIEASKGSPLADFLAALGVPAVGTATARNLAREFGTIEAFPLSEDADFDAFERRLRTIPDVGPTVAARVREFFESEENRAVVRELLAAGVDPRPAAERTGEELEGLAFAFTGSLSITRSDVRELVERRGGRTVSSVSAATTYLVVGDDPGRTKREEAAENGVPELDEAAFADLLRERGVEYPPA